MTWIVICSIGLGTYLLRVSMFALIGSRPIPARLDDALAFVGPAAIAALVATMLLTTHGQVTAAPLPEVAAVTAGFLAVRRTGNVMHAIVVGLPVLWALTLVGM